MDPLRRETEFFMSQDLHVCMLDIDAFRTVQGSGDQALLRSVLKSKRKRIERHDDYFRKIVKLEPYTPLTVAVRQIVDGAIDKALEPTFQFEHAATLLADAQGTPLEAGLFMETKAEFNAEIDRAVRELREAKKIKAGDWPELCKILQRGPLLNVPLDERMRLGSGYLTAEEAARAASAIDGTAFGVLAHGADYTWPDLALQAVLQYAGWLGAACAAKAGLFFHR